MADLKQRERELEAEALRVNAGRKPKFGDQMRNPWAGDNNPRAVGYFVREIRRTGRVNPGAWYEFTDGEGQFWETQGKYATFEAARSAVPAQASAAEKPIKGRMDDSEGVMGLTPYEFYVAGVSLRWYLKREVDALFAAAPVPAQGEPTPWRTPTQAEADEWAERNGIRIHGQALITAIEDAATLHLAAAQGQQEPGR